MADAAKSVAVTVTNGNNQPQKSLELASEQEIDNNNKQRLGVWFFFRGKRNKSH